jgi:hypothetical protein
VGWRCEKERERILMGRKKEPLWTEAGLISRYLSFKYLLAAYTKNATKSVVYVPYFVYATDARVLEISYIQQKSPLASTLN